MKKISKRSKCPISCALDILGDKWALLIIRDMMFKGKKTYGEFLNSDEKIATNILADRLVILERTGIIEKKDYPENKVKILYKLTQKGVDLIPALVDLVVWGNKYFEVTDTAKAFAAKIRENRDGVIRKLYEINF
jgi:DNA-binding HxlR family transcriptional regulator